MSISHNRISCYVTCRPQNVNKRKQKDNQILRPCQRTEKAVEHEIQYNTICSRYTQKGLDELEIRSRIETIQTTALLTYARILRRVQDT